MTGAADHDHTGGVGIQTVGGAKNALAKSNVDPIRFSARESRGCAPPYSGTPLFLTAA